LDIKKIKGVGMKVVKKPVSKSYSLSDFFVGEKQTEPNIADVTKQYTDKETSLRTTAWFDLQQDSIYITCSFFNEKVGADLGIKSYRIDLFDREEKMQIKLPQPIIGYGIIELLESYEVGFGNLGEGLISESLVSDDELITTKIWFSTDGTYMSISRKIQEEVVSEDLLAKLGF
jgi:hypothetical protein